MTLRSLSLKAPKKIKKNLKNLLQSSPLRGIIYLNLGNTLQLDKPQDQRQFFLAAMLRIAQHQNQRPKLKKGGEKLIGEDLLERAWIDSDWYYIETGKNVWQ